jgi:hypothetical protein
LRRRPGPPANRCRRRGLGLIALAGLLLNTYGIHDAYIYIGLLLMVYAVLAILAILATPETKDASLEG